MLVVNLFIIIALEPAECGQHTRLLLHNDLSYKMSQAPVPSETITPVPLGVNVL
jgi:hypothetical protein